MRQFAIISILSLLFFFQVAQGQSYDQYFSEGVLRLDLIITGSKTETNYALLGLKKEEFYSASKTILIDPFDYGDSKFELRDAASGKLIYSYTYCTLFREWQTTDEAAKVTRAYNHVLRFPMPKEKVLVQIFDRQRGGDFNLNWTEEINPASMFIDPHKKSSFEVVDIEINGPAEKKVDLLFVAEGYKAEEMDKFLEDAKRSTGYIFSEEPFMSHKKDFNIRAVLSISEDSGPDIPGHGVWSNTAMNANFYTFGIERYMTTNDYASVCDVAANAHYDQVYILVNTDKYGGGGIYNFYSISAADNASSREVVIHEFGHAFGGLADEYFTSAVAYNDFFNLEVEPWNPNLTTMVDFDSKWKDMLQKKTPVPTPAEEKYAETLGVYEGGGYVALGVFRPMIDCRMHSNDAVFCPVCSKAITQMIERYTK